MDSVVISFFTSLGLSGVFSHICGIALLIITLTLVGLLIVFIVKKILLSIIRRVVAKTPTDWDDILLERGFFDHLPHIILGLILYFSLPLIFLDLESFRAFCQRITLSYLIIMVVVLFSSFLSAVNVIYSTFQVSKNRPIKGYLQIIKVFFTIMGIVLVVSTLMDKSAIGLISGIGALSAVLMLIFKDSILGLVAAIQLSGNDMVRIGDWISLPDYGADGDVIDIKLQTVTVQNFDKTIVNVPIYSLISSSFKNWRGMSESGGRRIKRHLNIDMNSVKFCSPELVKELKGVELLSDFLEQRQNEIDKDNHSQKVNSSHPVNGRRMTNLGVFRAYVTAYLKAHPLIHDNMTFLVRQLQPTDKGIPLEIYVFSRDQVWSNYESIQADIFDHLLASIPFFKMAIYQTPSSLDFRESFKSEKKAAT